THPGIAQEETQKKTVPTGCFVLLQGVSFWAKCRCPPLAICNLEGESGRTMPCARPSNNSKYKDLLFVEDTINAAVASARSVFREDHANVHFGCGIGADGVTITAAGRNRGHIDILNYIDAIVGYCFVRLIIQGYNGAQRVPR